MKCCCSPNPFPVDHRNPNRTTPNPKVIVTNIMSIPNIMNIVNIVSIIIFNHPPKANKANANLRKAHLVCLIKLQREGPPALEQVHALLRSLSANLFRSEGRVKSGCWIRTG